MIIAEVPSRASCAGAPPRAKTISRLCVLLAAILVCLTTPSHADVRERDFRLVHAREGITTWEAARPREPLPAFRARMPLDADIWAALAILEDVDRACEWTSRCAEMRQLRRESEQAIWVYARIAAPWPVRDRDVVVRVSVSYGEPGELLVSITATTDADRARADGIVRMPRFDAHYRFQAVAPQRTEVEYQIDVDPGGTLPDWLKRVIARDLAHDTLADLRKRVQWAKMRGAYRERMRGLALRARERGFRELSFEANARDSAAR